MLEWAMRGSELHVPALWLWEIVNVVGMAVRRNRITLDRARDFLAQLATLNLRVALPPSVADLPGLQGLANRYALTAYDAAYLDLALNLSLPLASRDGDLRTAAEAEGVELLGM